MWKIIDRVVLAIFVIALVVLCFFQNCTIDKYFLVFGFAIAIMAAFTMFIQERKNKEMQSKKDKREE